MKYRWRDFEVFDEDSRERQELADDMGLCPIWDRTCANRVQRVWRASQQELGPSFIDEAHETRRGITEVSRTHDVAEYARRRFCERSIELTRRS